MNQARPRRATDFLEILSIESRFFVQRHEAKAERREFFIFASGVAELLKKTWQNQEASQILLLPESLFKFYGNGKQLILYFFVACMA